MAQLAQTLAEGAVVTMESRRFAKSTFVAVPCQSISSDSYTHLRTNTTLILDDNNENSVRGRISLFRKLLSEAKNSSL